MESIKGRCLGSRISSRFGRATFVYAFTCSDCGKTFQEPCPEVSAPALCHRCYTGEREPVDRKPHCG